MITPVVWTLSDGQFMGSVWSLLSSWIFLARLLCVQLERYVRASVLARMCECARAVCLFGGDKEKRMRGRLKTKTLVQEIIDRKSVV